MTHVRWFVLCIALILWNSQAHGQILTLTDPGLPDTRASAAAWGDVDNDGDLDLALAGLDTAGQAFTKIFENTGGVLTENTAHLLTGILWGDLDWGDFNNDGFPDLAISGQGQSGTDVFGVSEVYLNVNGVLLRAEERGRVFLGVDWLGRWRRSHAGLPSDVRDEAAAAVGERVTGHAQFTVAG